MAPGGETAPSGSAGGQRHRGCASAAPAWASLFALLSLLSLLDGARLGAVEVVLNGPLATVLDAPLAPSQRDAGAGLTISASLSVPDQAPADLAVMAFVRDLQGHWYQGPQRLLVHPGWQEVQLEIAAGPVPGGEPAGLVWTPAVAPTLAGAGLVLSTASASHLALRVFALHVAARPRLRAPVAQRLLALHLDGMAPSGPPRARATTGERWSLSVIPQPFPSDPFDPQRFSLDAAITGADGRTVVVPAFFDQPVRLSDRGDCELAQPQGEPRFVVRWRPRQAGTYRLQLRARWAGAPELDLALPDLQVAGPDWDGYARIDPLDHRFWSVAGRFYWPMALNLHAVTDLRSQRSLDTSPTPPRGSLAYDAYLARAGAAGISLVEIWMASWNLGLEWRADWGDFGGIGRFNQANAQRLDEVLDQAWAHGIRVNLVISNHGQASPTADSEWRNNPWSTALGGPLASPLGLFTDPRALAGQERLRRYLVARYADHPAVFGWKLWSEINLTAAGRMGMGRRGQVDDATSPEDRHAALVSWHAGAAAAWHALDSYGHGVSTHWSSDYRVVDHDITDLPTLDYLCIDAYLQRPGRAASLTLPELLFFSINDRAAGLGRIDKPILVTEYGGSPMAAASGPLAAELASAPWTALVSGLGACPMLWWMEWVDQGDRWRPFRALGAFLAGEDLRGRDSGSYLLAAHAGERRLWAAAWERPGRILGYVVDLDWVAQGGDGVPAFAGTVAIGELQAGPCLVEWWDADRGVLLASRMLAHAGGALDLAVPIFARHIAFKLIRLGDAVMAPR